MGLVSRTKVSGKKKLDIVELGEAIPEKFVEAAKNAKENVEDLEVTYYAGPRSFNYSVPSPLVEFKSETINRRGYGEDGLILINKVSSGKIR